LTRPLSADLFEEGEGLVVGGEGGVPIVAEGLDVADGFQDVGLAELRNLVKIS
jgi:hypothetical protein